MAARARVTVGLPADVHFHDVRHFTASLLIDGGASPLEVSEKLRHARPSVTLDVYSHRFRGADERTDAMLGDSAVRRLVECRWGTKQGVTRDSPGRTGADLHLLGADDGIRTRDPNLGKVDRGAQCTQAICA